MRSLPFPLPSVIAHRGASAVAPENTLAAFRRAADEGAAWIECDVKLTADGRPVVIHDDTLERTTDGGGAVADAPLDTIGALDAGGWFDPAFRGEPVPTLEETLDLLAELGLGANIEIKPCKGRERETAEVVAALVAAQGRDVPVLFSSFSHESLAAARDTAPSVPRGLLVWELPGDWQKLAETLDVVAIHADHATLKPDQVADVHSAGYRVLAYTVNDEATARVLVEAGVNAIITDAPGRIRSALDGEAG
ncbi:glycerophosphodiester phosphodiesterase [Caenispirillum salinarum]|uniref:glycerophosphodiester phosphodiesterase n=1 Tax=Caenispirillum salinarum TaxID=859058 RepID=UPI00384C7C0A